MFDIFLFVFGFISMSFFMPIIYFSLYYMGGFAGEKEKFMWNTYLIWSFASGITLFICLLVILIEGGASSSYVVGSIVGLIVPLIYWSVFLCCSIGKIVINDIRIKKIRNYLDKISYSKLNDSQKEKYQEYNDFLKKAESFNNDIRMKKCEKEIDKIICNNVSLRKNDIRYMNNSECFQYLGKNN